MQIDARWLKSAAAAVALLSPIAGAGGAWAVVGTRLSGVERRTEEVASSVQQLRADNAQQAKEAATTTDKRLDALDAALAEQQAKDAEQTRQMAVLEERLRTMGTTIDRMDRRQEVLLDRLNASPRLRNREFPQ